MSSNHNDKYKKIGLRIRKLRKSMNLTQPQFAELIGISFSHLTKIEAKNTNQTFSLDLLFEICDIIDVDIKYFFE